MTVPNWISKELKLIDELYFAVYNPYITERTHPSFGKGRWQIRKWLGVYSKPTRLWGTDMSEPILTICREEYSNERGLYDAGYKMIDMKDIEAIRQSNWWKLKWKKNIQEMDWRNERKTRQANAELEYQSKYAAKRIWRHLHEPTTCLPGIEWRK